MRKSAISRWLSTSSAPLFSAYAIVVSFSTYFCMYAFRKPFAAAGYRAAEDGAPLEFLETGLDLKTVFVISQIVGYCLSKYIGIKICSEVSRPRRLPMLLGLILAAELALVLFAVLPGTWKVAAIFLNGLPLGMVWGLVVWYLEGRRTSELLLAGLSCSFILSSGIVKDVGRALMAGDAVPFYGLDLPNPFGTVPEYWMPAATGLLFLVPFVVAALLLNQIPAPTQKDETERTHRQPMDGGERKRFLRELLAPLVMLFLAYFFLTAYRDFRDNYGVEIFAALGYADEPAVFSRTETWVAFGVLVPLALLFLVRNNRWGLIGCLTLITLGTALLGIGTLLLDAGAVDGVTWMVLTGLGSYLAFVPYGSVLFERLIAYRRTLGTAVFAIYVADALGYTGSVVVQLGRDLLAGEGTRLDFFRLFSYAMSVGGVALLLASGVLLVRRGRATTT